MAYRGACESTIGLAHNKGGAVPTGPAEGTGRDVVHQCSGSDSHSGDHYCGCGVSWNDRGEVTGAPWLRS